MFVVAQFLLQICLGVKEDFFLAEKQQSFLMLWNHPITKIEVKLVM